MSKIYWNTQDKKLIYDRRRRYSKRNDSELDQELALLNKVVSKMRRHLEAVARQKEYCRVKALEAYRAKGEDRLHRPHQLRKSLRSRYAPNLETAHSTPRCVE